MIFWQIIFWLGVFGLAHSYVLYPLIVRWLSVNKKPNARFFSDEELPRVSVLMSLFNEEKVVAEKLENLAHIDYPADKIRFYIGSDCSDDQTNALARQFADRHPAFHFFPFPERRGKPSVINDLAAAAFAHWPAAADHLLVITDASVFIHRPTIRRLARHFKNPAIDLVDTHMIHTGMSEEDISVAENEYISGEVRLKHGEGLVWQKMMGPFGGCYALRSVCFSPVPPNRLVDDFYLAMKVFEKGGGAINDLSATCEEAVSHDLRVEFRRKARISAGSFQNMFTFWRLWWPPVSALGFAFFSHKILRWLGPFWLLGILAGSGVLAFSGNRLYALFFAGAVFFVVGIPILDYLFKKLNVNVLWVKKINYFVLMNLALLRGFFRFLNGIERGTWAPTARI